MRKLTKTILLYPIFLAAVAFPSAAFSANLSMECRTADDDVTKVYVLERNYVKGATVRQNSMNMKNMNNVTRVEASRFGHTATVEYEKVVTVQERGRIGSVELLRGDKLILLTVLRLNFKKYYRSVALYHRNMAGERFLHDPGYSIELNEYNCWPLKF